MFTHVLDKKGKTVFEQDLPADPDVFLDALKPFRKNLVVGAARKSETPLPRTIPTLREDRHADSDEVDGRAHTMVDPSDQPSRTESAFLFKSEVA